MRWEIVHLTFPIWVDLSGVSLLHYGGAVFRGRLSEKWATTQGWKVGGVGPVWYYPNSGIRGGLCPGCVEDEGIIQGRCDVMPSGWVKGGVLSGVW